MVLNTEDRDVLQQARRHLQTMRETLPPDSCDTAPNSIVGALLAVSFQHCDSILILMQAGENDASVEALLRPAIESSLRLQWLAEDKDRAKQIMANKMNFPSFSRLMGRFAKKPTNKDTGDPVKALHDYAHAGMLQLIRHVSESMNKRDPLEQGAVLRGAAFLVVLLAMIACGSFCVFTERKDEGERIAGIFRDHLLRALTDALALLTTFIKTKGAAPG